MTYTTKYLAREIPDAIGDVLPVPITDIYHPQDRQQPPSMHAHRQGHHVTIGRLPEPEQQLGTLTVGEFTLVEGSDRRVDRDRYGVLLEGRPADVDIFTGPLEGLVLINFLFEEETEAAGFVPPDYCGQEVTHEAFLQDAALAGTPYGEIARRLGRLGYLKLEPTDMPERVLPSYSPASAALEAS